MRLELPVRLEKPLIICALFISLSVFDSLDAIGLGLWTYIIEVLAVIIIIRLLEKSGITEKEVPIWVGAFIIIFGFAVGYIFKTILNYTS
ncbi:hypothetical protein MO973_03115 [Paenibacillus sp. TRM 82003]|nr:hypothetical protein [Paenibacillus sp. TRM 82003]